MGQLSALNAFSGWTPPVGYVPMRLKDSLQRSEVHARRPYRRWRPGAQAHEVLSNSTMAAIASVQQVKLANKRLQREACVQRQEIASLWTHMSALELEAELRDCWHKEFKEVRYIGNDTFVVAYTIKM